MVILLADINTMAIDKSAKQYICQALDFLTPLKILILKLTGDIFGSDSGSVSIINTKFCPKTNVALDHGNKLCDTAIGCQNNAMTNAHHIQY